MGMTWREVAARALQVNRSFIATHCCETIKSNPSGRQLDSQAAQKTVQAFLDLAPHLGGFDVGRRRSRRRHPGDLLELDLPQDLVKPAEHAHRVDKQLHAWDDSGPSRLIRRFLGKWTKGAGTAK